LTKKHGIAQSTIDANLTVVPGNATNKEDVKTALSHNAAIIIDGLGGSAKFQMSLFQPFTIDQPSICADGMHMIIAALKDLQADGVLTTKPLIVTVSTTGISKTRDVPYLLVPLYHWVLAVPHIDKSEMEKAMAMASVASGGFYHRSSIASDRWSIARSRQGPGWMGEASECRCAAGGTWTCHWVHYQSC
jgi:hypothetical protein